MRSILWIYEPLDNHFADLFYVNEKGELCVKDNTPLNWKIEGIEIRVKEYVLNKAEIISGLEVCRIEECDFVIYK